MGARFGAPTGPSTRCSTRQEEADLGDLTTIPLTKATRDRLKRAGRKGETYDALVNRLLEIHEQLESGARLVVPFEEVRE